VAIGSGVKFMGGIMAVFALMLQHAAPARITYQYGGTFIGAVVCSDGIAVVSDSRTTFLDGEGTAFGYLDGMPKIFVDRETAVAISGMVSLDGELFSSFLKHNLDFFNAPANEILFGLLLHMPFTNTNNVAMISAGFVDGRPMICAKSPIAPQTCSRSGFFTNKPVPLLHQTFDNLNRPLTVSEAVALLKASIEKASLTDQAIGGPTSVLKLSKGEPPQWLTEPPSDRAIEKVCDLVRKRRAEIVPLSGQPDLDRRLTGVCGK
jgi:hypothetical protein